MPQVHHNGFFENLAVGPIPHVFLRSFTEPQLVGLLSGGISQIHGQHRF